MPCLALERPDSEEKEEADVLQGAEADHPADQASTSTADREAEEWR